MFDFIIKKIAYFQNNKFLLLKLKSVSWITWYDNYLHMQLID